MAHPRKFRFGVQLSTAASGEEWAATAREVEDLGYSTLFLPDHFGDQLAPVPAMMAAADATTDLKVGTLVFDNDYVTQAVSQLKGPMTREGLEKLLDKKRVHQSRML